MNQPKKTFHQAPTRSLSADQAIGNLLHLVHRYIDGNLCPDCEERISATLCSQLQMLAQAPSVGAATREGCLELMEHWMRPASERMRFINPDEHGTDSQPQA